MSAKVYNKYNNTELFKELAELMIPDACQYISNIQHCLLEANESMMICNDIYNQLFQLRKEHQKYYSTFSYRVGTLSVDGRAYANRNLRSWCSNINKVQDSLLQIVNIVFDINLPDNNVKYSNTVNETNDDKLKELCNELKKLIDFEITFDNQSKHRLNSYTFEDTLGNFSLSVNFLFRNDMPVIEIINEKREDDIHGCIGRILDYLIMVAKTKEYDGRKYVIIDYDPEIRFANNVLPLNDLNINKVKTIDVYLKSNECDKRRALMNISKAESSQNIPSSLFLASLYCEKTSCGEIYKIAKFDYDQIDCSIDGNFVGRYSLQKNQEIGLHFGKYLLES